MKRKKCRVSSEQWERRGGTAEQVRSVIVRCGGEIGLLGVALHFGVKVGELAGFNHGPEVISSDRLVILTPQDFRQLTGGECFPGTELADDKANPLTRTLPELFDLVAQILRQGVP
jgi:hypothetical protein